MCLRGLSQNLEVGSVAGPARRRKSKSHPCSAPRTDWAYRRAYPRAGTVHTTASDRRPSSSPPRAALEADLVDAHTNTVADRTKPSGPPTAHPERREITVPNQCRSFAHRRSAPIFHPGARELRRNRQVSRLGQPAAMGPASAGRALLGQHVERGSSMRAARSSRSLKTTAVRRVRTVLVGSGPLEDRAVWRNVAKQGQQPPVR